MIALRRAVRAGVAVGVAALVLGACAASRRSGGGGERRALPVCASAAEDAPGVLAFGVREDPDVPLGAELIAMPSLDRPRSPSDDVHHRPRIQDERIVFGGDRLLAFSPETGVVASFDARA